MSTTRRIATIFLGMLLTLLIYFTLSYIFSDAVPADPEAWQTVGGTGTVRLGNYRVVINGTVYVTSYPCDLNWETLSYKLTYVYMVNVNSVWTRSSGRMSVGEFTVNTGNTVYNRLYVTTNSTDLYAEVYDGSVQERLLLSVGDKLYFDTLPTDGASEFIQAVFSHFMSSPWIEDTGRYSIEFDVPIALQVGQNIWSWDGDRSTFYLYQSYDSVLISMLDQSNMIFPVIFSQQVTTYHFETVISDEWGTKTDGWLWLVDIIQRASGMDELDYYRFVVEMQETTINDLSAQLGEIIGTPDQPIPQSVLIAEGVKQEIEDTFSDANAIVADLTEDLERNYLPVVETAADQQFTAVFSNINNDDVATLSSVFSWLIGGGILTGFLVVMLFVKVLVNAHRKMGD